jgi:5'-3' exonuclease
MGVQSDFPKNLKAAASESVSLRDFFGGSVLAIDISIFVWQLFQAKEGHLASIDEFHSQPPRPISALKPMLVQLQSRLVRNNIDFILVLDGIGHPNKLASLERKAKSKVALFALAQLLIKDDNNTPEDLKKIADLKKKSINAFRADIEADLIKICVELRIKYIRAPYEADPQLVQLCNSGIAHAVYSTDSDIAVLGYSTGIKWIHAIDFDKGTAQIVDFSKDSTKLAIATLFLGSEHAQEHPQTRFHRHMMHVIACVLGNDYMPPVKWFSTDNKARNLLFKKLSACPLGVRFESAVCEFGTRVQNSGNTWKAMYGLKDQPAKDFLRLLDIGRAMYEVPPVFVVSKKSIITDGRSIFELMFSADWQLFIDIRLEPLYPLAAGQCWKETLGFDPSASMNLYRGGADGNLGDIFYATMSRELCCINGVTTPRRLSEDRLKNPRTLDGREACFESELSFDKVKMCHISKDALQKFLACRSIRPNLDTPRHKLEALVKKITDAWQLRGSKDYPLVLPASQFTLAHYLDIIQLVEGGGFSWIISKLIIAECIHGRHAGCDKPSVREAILSMGNLFCTGPSEIKRILRLAEGGFTDIATLQMSFGRRSANSGGAEVVVVKCNVVSSMRVKTQTVLLVFNKVGGAIQPPPITRCSCEAGRYACSHMYCLLFVLASIQRHYSDRSLDYVAKAFPEPVRLLSGKLIPMQYIYGAVTQKLSGDA